MSTSPVPIRLLPGFRGFVAAVVNADFQQEVYFEVRDANDRQRASSTFQGRGRRVHMIDMLNNRPHWSFGPFNFEATLYVKILNYNGASSAIISKMVGPLSIDKEPEPDYPMKFHSSTVISEDGQDSDHDDCTVTVLQYLGKA